jgi:preprotein translocase subunit SecE
VARNRKRAKERRARRPHAASPGVATAPTDRAPDPIAHAPDPIAHATPDVELVDAQLAVGRPEPLEGEDEAELEAELEAEAEEEATALAGDGVRRADGAPQSAEAVAASAGAPGAGALAGPRVGLSARLVAFLQGSWRELQRVQWPDRRQVVQATSVVIGFVIVAGVFLWVADILAGHIVTFVLNGHW